MAEGNRSGIIVVVLVAVGLLVFLFATETGQKLLGRGEPELPAELTHEALLERGRYLVEGPMHCFACHSPVAWDQPGTPPVAGMKGAGTLFPEQSIPFTLNAPNITPDPETGIGSWTDEEIGRAIREGIGRDGRRLFPLMGYMDYRHMSNRDLAAVIAYLRSIPPVNNPVGPSPLPEPVKALLPPPMPITAPVPPPDPRDPVKRGEYMARLAHCSSCHTPLDFSTLQRKEELFLAGGFSLTGPWGQSTGPNITPDASGIAHYDEEMFIRMMRSGQVVGKQLNPIMLTGYFRHMTDQDLKDLWAYLRTLPPIQHRVDNTEPAAPCKLCGGVHGYGDRN
jgi:mono/diheme cytochrome c family protein